MIEEGYRKPTIDEFVQDFEFEYLYEAKVQSILNIGTPEQTLGEASYFQEWTPMKVWWLSNTMVTTEDEEGNRYSYTPHPIFDCPFDIQVMLNLDKIRVKI